MEDTKTIEGNEEKIAENKTNEETKGKTKGKTITTTILINVKYGDTPYKAGEKITIKEGDIEEFKRAGAIKIE